MKRHGACGLVLLCSVGCAAKVGELEPAELELTETETETAEPVEEKQTVMVDFTSPEQEDGVNPVLLDTVKYRSQTIHFIKIPEVGGDFSIMVGSQGVLTEGDVYATLLERSEYPLTPAEIWSSLTARDDVPVALRTDHERKVLLDERPTEIQKIPVGEPLVSKATFPINWSVLLPFVPLRCWNHARVGMFDNSFFPNNQTTYCSEAVIQNPAGIFRKTATPVTSGLACSGPGAKGPIRLAAFNDGQVPSLPIQRTQWCYGPSSAAAWACFGPTFDFVPGNYIWLDWDTSTVKWLGVGFENISTTFGYRDLAVSASLQQRTQGLPNNLCFGERLQSAWYEEPFGFPFLPRVPQPPTP